MGCRFTPGEVERPPALDLAGTPASGPEGESMDRPETSPEASGRETERRELTILMARLRGSSDASG